MILERGETGETYRPMLSIFLLALVLGVFFTFFITPWQHYDEPTQFEYAWLIANRPGLPQPGDFDQGMRREVAASMLEHGFFDGLDFRPNLLSQTEPVWIGISQLDDQPLYYWFAALPLRLLKYTDVTTQLYAARLVSLLFFLGMLAAGMGLVQEIAGRRDTSLAWLVPLTLVLIPGVLDSMTSVNNDVGAAFFFTLFLWGSARLVRGGLRWFELGWVVAAAGLCYFTKPTVFAALVLLPLVLLFSIFKKRYQWVPWFALLAGSLALAIGVFGWGNAAAWESFSPQAGQNRMQASAGQGEASALVMNLYPSIPKNVLIQPITVDLRNAIKGKTTTLAGWIWSDRAAAVEIGFNARTGWHSFQLFTATKEKQLVVAQIHVPETADYPWVELHARMIESEREGQVYFTDLWMLPGELSRQQVRDLYDLIPKTGLAGVESPENGLSNPSAERGWFRLRSWIMPRLPFSVLTNLNTAVSSFSNLPATGWYYRAAIRNLFQTFWARFGWSNVPLLGKLSYLVLGLVTTIALVAYLIVVYRVRKTIDWALFILLMLSAGIIWSQTILRGVGSLHGPLLLPAARYALPVVVLTIFPFVAGWRGIANILDRRAILSRRNSLAIYVVFLAVLNILAIYSIIKFYSG